ncbi:MAG: hypothetical protein CR980_01310 [Propionibacteriales bacterium]|nr:MAG: hypothetical protein CR980_01310 [Propionibacteriales bacterium]
MTKLIIDCDQCTRRGIDCSDCVVSALLPASEQPELTPVQHRAVAVLSAHGLVPPLRMNTSTRSGLVGS